VYDFRAAAQSIVPVLRDCNSKQSKLLNLQARGDDMIWLKRQQQADAGHTALVGLMDALLHLQQGDMLHVPGLILKDTL